MFAIIFRFEMRYWLRQPSVYIYAAVFLFATMFLMQGTAGGWDPPSVTDKAAEIANSPIRINWMITFFTQLVLFLIPAIIGLSVYRDYRSRMHTVLYSFPFTKGSYLFAKFLSAFLILLSAVSMLGIGVFLGTLLPGIPAGNLGPFHLSAYLHSYLVYVIPNLLLFGAIVFAAVVLTRNIYSGFIIIILLYFLQGLLAGILTGLENSFLAALFDPFGKSAANYYTRYWTLAEQNTMLLPFQGVIIYNRLLWLIIAAGIFAAAYRYFSFSQQAISFGNKPKAEPAADNTSSGIVKIQLPEVPFQFSLVEQLKTTWRLSNVELQYILKSRMFQSILLGGMLMVFFQQARMGPQNGFEVLPVTWIMLRIPTFLFSGIINILTFLYAGMLVNRAAAAQMNQLVDVNPVPNWSLLLSKFIALLKMQLILITLIMIGGILAQTINGYYHYEIPLYLFELYGMNFIGFAIWACAALFVQTIFTNPYLGFFLLLLGSMGMAGLPELGINHFVFRFNLAREMEYSDLNGYGRYLLPYFLYKFYWAMSGIVLLVGAFIFWIRGLPQSFKERLGIARRRFRGKTAITAVVFLTVFLGLGSGIYYEDSILNKKITTPKQQKALLAESDKKYKRYQHLPQPKIESVYVNMNIFPENRSFQADGKYVVINKSNAVIDTLLISTGFDEQTEFQFDRPATVFVHDSTMKFSIHILENSLQPNDSLQMTFDIRNHPNTIFQRNSNVLRNGTFILSDIFPRFMYRTKRETPPPSDSSAHWQTYQSRDTDDVAFEAIVSTAGDQIAITPGYLQDSWQEDGRQFFHYKMDRKIKFYFGFNSGRFQVMRDTWQNIDLEIYYHQPHHYNLERMMRGLKASLAYNAANFSPYQHRQARIIEFPVSEGTHATTFANSIPFSEYRFITNVDDSNPDAVDIPFYVAVHELAHQWWGNQVIPSNTLGAKMITESLSEYVALRVLEKEYGKSQMRKFLKLCLDSYLKGRGRERNAENPLMLADHQQQYIAYRKGSMVFYALSDYIGEAKLNGVLRRFLAANAFQGPPYTTSAALVDSIRQVVPDSLQYLIKDMFETITLYDNKVTSSSTTELPDGRCEVTIDFTVSKYRSDGKGKRLYSDSEDSLTYRATEGQSPISSLPLSDYIEVGVFGAEKTGDENGDSVLYLRKHHIQQINNTMTIIVDEKPAEVGIDPYNKLIDTISDDNRRRL